MSDRIAKLRERRKSIRDESDRKAEQNGFRRIAALVYINDDGQLRVLDEDTGKPIGEVVETEPQTPDEALPFNPNLAAFIEEKFPGWQITSDVACIIAKMNGKSGKVRAFDVKGESIAPFGYVSWELPYSPHN
jgi:hypothetical protein